MRIDQESAKESVSSDHEASPNPLDFNEALRDVCERHPELAERIKRSLETPQSGKYHNEGSTMESHLKLILATLEDVRDGRLHAAVSDDPELLVAMQRVAVVADAENPERRRIKPEIVDYVFLHDISKPDTMLLTLEGGEGEKGEKVEVTWEEWQERGSKAPPFTFDGKHIASIGYYHPSEKAHGRHGERAVEDVLGNTEVPTDIQRAIAFHEVAIGWEGTAAKKYEEKFIASNLTEDQQVLSLLASYIDTMGSLNEYGSPNLENFKNILQARRNYLLIQKYIDAGTVFGEKQLNILKNLPIVTPEDIERVLPHEVSYDREKVEVGLATLVSEGKITDADQRVALETMFSESDQLGRKLGKAMRHIKPLLKEWENQ